MSAATFTFGGCSVKSGTTCSDFRHHQAMCNVTSAQATRSLLDDLEILGMISIGMRSPEHSKITSQQSAVTESLRLFCRPRGHWKGMGALLYTGTLGICLAVVVCGLLIFWVQLPYFHFQKASGWSNYFFACEPFQDGMDQSKWRIPRYSKQRPLKSTSMLQRPQLKVQGCWVHGVALDLWVTCWHWIHCSSYLSHVSEEWKA